MNRKIMVIDDEETVLQDYLRILADSDPEMDDLRAEAARVEAELFGPPETPKPGGRESYEVTAASQGEEGYLCVRKAREDGAPFALAFVDIRMPPGWDGVETARRIREIDKDIEIVIVTAYSDRERREIVRRVGTPEKLLYLKKPFDPDEIRQLALSLTKKYSLERKAERHRAYLEKLLNAVRRLKTLNTASVREVLAAILSEVLYFVDGCKGFIAVKSQAAINVEIVSEKMTCEAAEAFIRKMKDRLDVAASVDWVDGMMILPLKGGTADHFILVSNIAQPVGDAQLSLLTLLMETAAEVLAGIIKQEKYLKNEKIATIGQIAAGILHEIKNPLQAITGYMDLGRLQMGRLESFIQTRAGDLKDPAPLQQFSKQMAQYFAFMKQAADQVRNLTENIRSFTQIKESFEPEMADLSEALDNTLILAHNALKYGVKVHKDWKRPLMAWCDINTLRQVFLNLVLNAVQAMEGRGELWIAARQEGDAVRISVKDSGPGVSAGNMEKIFNAFYTTKPDGTGLGLSIVKGIIEKHKGTVRVTSAPGKGAAFHVEIPVRESA